LADAERRIAIASGPKFVDTADDYAVLLDQSGWCLQERTNVTPELLIASLDAGFLRRELFVALAGR
jgi:hypothetical protein